MYSSQPFKVKCHLDCESCLFGRWDAHFHWELLGRHSMLLRSHQATVVEYAALKAIEQWIDMKTV